MGAVTPDQFRADPTEADAAFEHLVLNPGRPETVALPWEPYFRERPTAVLRRLVLGLAYLLRPNRIALLPHLIWLSLEHLISPSRAARRLRSPRFRGWQGLVGVSNDLSPKALIDAYRRGIFPVSHIGSMKWWSPDIRAVLDPSQTRVEKNLRRLIRQKKYRVTFDTDFAGVMRACAEPRPGKTPLTWITPTMMAAFWKLHAAGYAHSVEVWDATGHLVGGLYGLAIGDVFFGESQFAAVRDSSKIAVTTLHCHLAHWGFALRDAKWPTEHLASLGFQPMPREELIDKLQEHAWKPDRVGRWSVDETLDVAGWQTKA